MLHHQTASSHDTSVRARVHACRQDEKSPFLAPQARA
jgi:hypothetical protein